MFCSSCGAADQVSKSYCRHCGQWLIDPKSAGSRTAKTPEQRMNIMAAFSAVSSLLATISLIALYATYLGTPEAKWSIYLAGACLTVIAAHQAVNFFFARSLKKARKRSQSGATRDTKSEIRADKATSQLSTGQLSASRLSAGPEHVLAAPSVIEDTTQLLEGNPRPAAPRTPDHQ